MPSTTSIAELARRRALVYGDGYRTKRAEHGEPGYRILRVADVVDGDVRLDGLDHVRREFGPKIGHKISRPGDVLVTTKGTVGRVAIYPSTAEEVVYSPQLCFFRVIDATVISPRYLAYWFCSPEFGSQALHRANNTDMAAYINLRDIASLRMHLPAIDEQFGVADVLGALDDKIATNGRMVGRAKAISRALLDRDGADASSARLVDLVETISRGVAPSYVDADGLLVLNQKCVRDQYVDLAPARRSGRAPSADRLLRRDDVLVNSTGYGTLGRAARWTRHDTSATVDSHVTIVRFDEKKVDPVCAGLALTAMEDEIEQLAQGSTGQTELRRELLAELEITLPAPDVQRALSPTLRAMDYLELARRAENERLIRTRDELLPLLMSGKIRVKGAEKVVEEVL